MATKSPMRHVGAAKAKAAKQPGPSSMPKHTASKGAVVPAKLAKVWGLENV